MIEAVGHEKEKIRYQQLVVGCSGLSVSTLEVWQLNQAHILVPEGRRIKRNFRKNSFFWKMVWFGWISWCKGFAIGPRGPQDFLWNIDISVLVLACGCGCGCGCGCACACLALLSTWRPVAEEGNITPASSRTRPWWPALESLPLFVPQESHSWIGQQPVFKMTGLPTLIPRSN